MVQWNFKFRDIIHSEDVAIAVCAENYKQAILRVDDLDIPNLDTDKLILVDVIEPLPSISYNFTDDE